MSEYYPPAGFYFTVQLLGSATAVAGLTEIDASFRDVSGISVDASVEEVVEGGENRFVHKLPRPAKYSNLVLERGIVTRDSVLGEWVAATVGSRLAVPILPQNLVVMLLDGGGSPSVLWIFVNAYPVRWELASLSSEKNEVLTEKLEFAYNYFERIRVGSAMSIDATLAKAAASLT